MKRRNRLAIDVRLQQVAEQALGEHSGAVVAIDPRNGEILAFVSQPTFDPNWFVNGIALEDYRTPWSRQDDPQFNRALRGQYPPGSTVKPFLAFAGLACREEAQMLDQFGGPCRAYRQRVPMFWPRRAYGDVSGMPPAPTRSVQSTPDGEHNNEGA